MNRGQPSASRVRLLLAAVSGCLVVLVASAHSRMTPDAASSPNLDVVFEAIASTIPRSAVEDRVDLHDGRSPVPLQWQATFERFSRDDRIDPPAPGGIVFIGSSSIELWDGLPAQFPGARVVQRGLGAATIADCTRHLDRLVMPYRPRVVVVYAGDNDLATGMTPEHVVADYAELVRQVHDALPETRFVFVSIKPSPVRAGLMPMIRRTNALMTAYAHTDKRLDFVDIFDAMLDREAHARRELFRIDGLHMTAAGYAIWRDALTDHLH